MPTVYTMTPIGFDEGGEMESLSSEQVERMRTLLTPGTVFYTPFESGCVVVTPPDQDGWFSAKDSEGVICSYCLMIGGMPYGISRQGEAL